MEEDIVDNSIFLFPPQLGKLYISTIFDCFDSMVLGIRRCIDETPDITIEEIREKLDLSASYSTVERAIRTMGHTLKKKSLYASKRDRVQCAGKA